MEIGHFGTFYINHVLLCFTAVKRASLQHTQVDAIVTLYADQSRCRRDLQGTGQLQGNIETLEAASPSKLYLHIPAAETGNPYER